MLFYDIIMILGILSPLSPNLDTSEEWLGLHSQFPLPCSGVHCTAQAPFGRELIIMTQFGGGVKCCN